MEPRQPTATEPVFFKELRILRPGKLIKEAAKARLNREQAEVQKTLTHVQIAQLETLSRNLTDDSLYPFTVEELWFLGLWEIAMENESKEDISIPAEEVRKKAAVITAVTTADSFELTETADDRGVTRAVKSNKKTKLTKDVEM